MLHDHTIVVDTNHRNGGMRNFAAHARTFAAQIGVFNAYAGSQATAHPILTAGESV